MFNKVLPLIFFSFVFFLSSAVAKEAILTLNTNGHTSVIRAMDTTQDGRHIVTAGDDKVIYVWDAKTGKEVRRMGGYVGLGAEGQVYALALSRDERYLAVGGWLSKNSNGYGDIRIYDFRTGKIHKVLQSHTSVVYDLDFSDDGKYLVSVSVDKTAKIWDRKDWNLQATIAYHTDKIHSGRIFNSSDGYRVVTVSDDHKTILSSFDDYSGRIQKISEYTHGSDIPENVAVNKKHIAVATTKEKMMIFDHDLNFVQEMITTYSPQGLDYSPNGRYLGAGSGSNTAKEVIAVYDSHDDYRLIKTFHKHTSTAFSVSFLDNDTLVSGGGDHKEIYAWNIFSGSVEQTIIGAGDVIWSVGIKGDKIAWGHVFDTRQDFHEVQSSFSHSFDLKTMQISRDTFGFNRAVVSKDGWRIKYAAGGKYGSSDAVLEVYDGSRRTARIVKTSSTGYSHRCYTWYKDYVISGGGNGALMVYDRYGTLIADLVGHNGSVWSVAVDGDRLVSGSDDQTIRLWDLSQLGKSKTMKPMLNIFVATNEEFIVWSESGFYDASVGGDKYIGYHINQGRYKESRFVGSDRFYETNYRPDIIASILNVGNENDAIAQSSRVKKVEKVDVVSSLPPEVVLMSEDFIKTDKSQVDVEFMVLNGGEKIKEVVITLNGRKTKTRALKKKKLSRGAIHKVGIDLEEGENIINIMARNRHALSSPVTVTVHRKRTHKKNIYKPDLYVIAIGVSEYKNKSYNLGVADKDALAISKLFHTQKGKVYNNVEIKTLTNERATKDNILDALDWINAQTTQRDVALIFIAGHGVNDDYGKYYFLNHEADLDKLRRTALKWVEFEETLNNLPSKVILLADTCHSGNIAGKRRDMTSAIKSIVNSGTGQVIMTATTGNGYSYEQKDWGHGAFTKALIEGLGDQKADYDGDNTVSIKELDLYVTKRVKKLTKGKQKPTTIIPSSIPDFAVVYR